MTIFNDYHYFKISEHFISAIVNDDYSGLTDQEENELNRFLSTANLYKNATWEIVEGEPRFIDCDVSGSWGNCHVAKLHFFNDSI